ncbi:MAG: ABC transporter ATP-binding protein/permease [Bacillota bacterium]|nr:ABC transporter ATP-binding protein/permease [Bacillota bacterium]
MMVRLENVNKFFNKRKQNEIHVIKGTTLSMESSGLVAFLGPSGCGKTTLLNVIGGLDKVNSGQVFINGQQITGRSAGKTDRIRNLNIGYVFQNYNLVDNMTVFDNVALALKMVGVKDKQEIEEKVNYVLEKVGMYRYRNRYADMLSGGERQRVGIARAIVKDPAIVIADEPTGNLDSKNTLEVMNIIKAISVDKLVILVTHEEELADFYASRIIRIKDGEVVSDVMNGSSDDLDYRVENKVYLRDIKDHKRLKTANYNIDFYNDSNSPVSLDIVVKNGNIYIKTRNENDRVEVIDENSSIELVDDHYKQISKEASIDGSYEPEKLKATGERKYGSIIGPLEAIKKGFKTVRDYNTLKKILMVGFAISAMFITYSVCNIFGVMNITDDEFVGTDKSYISVISKNVSVDKYLEYEKNENFSYIMPGDSMISLQMPFEEYMQTLGSYAAINGSLSDSAKLTASDIMYGEQPKASNELVVDKMILEQVIDEQMTKPAGYGTPASFVGATIEIENLPDMVIVGVSDLQSPCIYASSDMFINILANTSAAEDEDWDEDDSSVVDVVDYKLVEDDIELEKGSWPKNAYEVIINEKNKDDVKIGKTIKEKVNDKKLKVVGYYSDKHDSDYLYVSNETVKYALVTTKSNITIDPIDKDLAIEELRAVDINVRDTYEESRQQYRKQMWEAMLSTLVMAGVILLISFIEIYLIIRASFLSRVKEVGVYRAIGVKKADIYRMFAGEILGITTLAGMPGFIFMSYLMYKLSGSIYFADMYLVNPIVLIICFALIYGLNLVFGLLPVFRTIRKTPAAILSRTDVN